MADEVLSGWGRAGWSRAALRSVASADEVVDVVGEVTAGTGAAIARGLGRSYADQAMCAGGTVLDTTSLTGPIEIGPDGVVTLSAGVSLNELLRVSVPQGWFVPVSPGTRHVTVGGAIAADIHGKNHHADGTFCCHVSALQMVLADGTSITCSASDNADIFWATAGGMGLTGIITSATIRMSPIETSRLLVDTTRLENLDDLMTAMTEADRSSPFSVAWVDLMAPKSAGRAVLTTARFATPADLPSSAEVDPLAYNPGKPLSAPRWVPQGLLRHSTVRAFNEAWYRAAPKSGEGQLQSISRYFHPLDGVTGWNRMYGSGGFLQWQMAVPDGSETALETCIAALTNSSAPSFLAVLKRFGAANDGPLSFPLRGWTLAADIPARHPGLAEELDHLDKVVADAGGRIYLAKDGRMNAGLLNTMYPRLGEWKAIREQLDPRKRLASDFSRRLGL